MCRVDKFIYLTPVRYQRITSPQNTCSCTYVNSNRILYHTTLSTQLVYVVALTRGKNGFITYTLNNTTSRIEPHYISISTESATGTPSDGATYTASNIDRTSPVLSDDTTFNVLSPHTSETSPNRTPPVLHLPQHPTQEHSMQVAVIVVVVFVCVLLLIIALVRLCAKLRCDLCDIAAADIEAVAAGEDSDDGSSQDDIDGHQTRTHMDDQQYDDNDDDLDDDIDDRCVDYHRKSNQRFGLTASMRRGVENCTFELDDDDEDDINIQCDDTDADVHELGNGNIPTSEADRPNNVEESLL